MKSSYDKYNLFSILPVEQGFMYLFLNKVNVKRFYLKGKFKKS